MSPFSIRVICALAMTQPQPAFKDAAPIGGTGWGNKYLPNTTDWLGRWRLAANATNDWEIDRASQRNNVIYSGIAGVHLQDQAITESMGPIVDHSFEHLAPSDQMITRTRRRLLIAARALRDGGELPPGAQNAEMYRRARGGYFVSDDKSLWQQVVFAAVVGGLYVALGPTVGAIITILLTEILRISLGTKAAGWDNLIYGVLLVLLSAGQQPEN
jgi:hypothetical protein